MTTMTIEEMKEKLFPPDVIQVGVDLFGIKGNPFTKTNQPLILEWLDDNKIDYMRLPGLYTLTNANKK